MKGLMLKEFYATSAYRKSFLGMIVIVAIVCVFLDNNYTMAPLFLMMFLMIVSISIYQIDEKTSWDSFAVSTPATRSTIVAARYLSLALAMVVVDVLGFALGAGIAIAQGLTGWLAPLATICGMMALLFLFVHSIVAPLAYKFGAEKSRILMMLVFLVPYMGVVWLSGQVMPLIEQQAAIPVALIAALASLVCIGMFVGSWRLSSRIYAAKEF